MPDINQWGYNSLRSIKEDGAIINMADVQDTKIRSGSLMGRVSLTASATLMKIGTANLTNRHTLNIINDSSAIIFLDFSSAVNTSTSFLLNSGSGVSFSLDPSEDVSVWGLTTEETTDVGVWELK